MKKDSLSMRKLMENNENFFVINVTSEEFKLLNLNAKQLNTTPEKLISIFLSNKIKEYKERNNL